MGEILNKVQESKLIQLDPAQFKPRLELVGIDIADQLWQGLILKEKEFRSWIKEHDWQQYRKKGVYIYCSADAIVPTWAFMLVASQISQIASAFVIGTIVDLEKLLIKAEIDKMVLTPYVDGMVIIKGCSDIQSIEFLMGELIHVLQPVAKSIMFGEPCSTVPIFKRK